MKKVLKLMIDKNEHLLERLQEERTLLLTQSERLMLQRDAIQKSLDQAIASCDDWLTREKVISVLQFQDHHQAMDYFRREMLNVNQRLNALADLTAGVDVQIKHAAQQKRTADIQLKKIEKISRDKNAKKMQLVADDHWLIRQTER